MKHLFKAVLLFAVTLLCLNVSAASWFVRGNKYAVETVVVTGNYKSPRLIAELIQSESRQPYILVPAANARQNFCYVAMPKTHGVALSEDKFGAWVKFSGARRVVILGDNKGRITKETYPVIKEVFKYYYHTTNPPFMARGH